MTELRPRFGVKSTPQIISTDFAEYLTSAGADIERKQNALDIAKWTVAEAVNLEWRDEGYEAERVNKKEFYGACCQCLPFRLFGKSGETLRRWCETQAHFDRFNNIDMVLRATSFDHLLKAKRLEQNKKIDAIKALGTAIEEDLTADEMVTMFDPEHDGIDSRHFKLTQLYSLSESAWIPKEAGALILAAARIIDAELKKEKR